jgi:hypothetical protein
MQDLQEAALTREQAQLVGRGCSGPAVSLDGILLSDEQVKSALSAI